MSRIGENSDESRIREMAEADQRMKADREKRGEVERVTKSFQEVMTQRSQRETAQRVTAQTQAEADAQAVLHKRTDPNAADKKKPVILGNPRQQELQKRAALATAQQGQMAKVRTQLAEHSTKLETERNVDLARRSDDDIDNIRRDVDRDVSRERRLEEQHDPRLEASIGVDPDEDGRGRDQRGRDSGGRDEGDRPAPAAVGATKEAPRGANTAKLPTEILEHIAKSVAIAAAADGKVSMSVSLKGSMLEGVTLHVTANKGKVRCVFENCDKQLGNLIEASKGELMRQLGKRGFELDILRVK